jgi:hypothetical protein
MKTIRTGKRQVLIGLLILLISGCRNEKREVIEGSSTAYQCNEARTIRYSQDVVPILQYACIGCHSGSSPQGGISLDTYDRVKAVAQTGQLLGSIKHSPGYRPMPPSGKLPDSTICIIETWIQQGMQNN